jgi:hypothetical protein
VGGIEVAKSTSRLRRAAARAVVRTSIGISDGHSAKTGIASTREREDLQAPCTVQVD